MPIDEQVLVALLKDRAALERACEQHWYHIPVKSAPRAIEAPRIAFYQTKVFKDEKWSIRYHAPVLKREILTRRELMPDAPAHPRANLPYYKLSLGPLETLARPIVSRRGRRLVFVSTTRAKFRAAREINDLFHESPLEDSLWCAFKQWRIRAERQVFVRANQRRYCLDFALFCRRGSVDVECDGDRWHSQPETVVSDNQRNNDLASAGWSVLRFSTRDITDEPENCLDLVRRTIKQLGGIRRDDIVLEMG